MITSQLSLLDYPPPYDFLVRNHHAYSQKLYIDSQFNNYLWRSILDSIVADIDKTKTGVQVISPFGFEVTQNKRFLKSNLRRFYCYIGIPNHVPLSKDCIITEFDDKLCSLLEKIHPDFYKQVVLKIHEQEFIKLRKKDYCCNRNNKLIDIQLRKYSSSLLDDYADYIICCLPAIYHGQDEPKEFLFNARFRNRTYQLYVMIEALFGSHITNMSATQMDLLNKTYKRINNAINIFFNDAILYTTADELDKTILNQLIIPRTEEMIATLNTFDDRIEIQSRSYHVNEKLSFNLNKNIYDDTKKFIINSYNEYY